MRASPHDRESVVVHEPAVFVRLTFRDRPVALTAVVVFPRLDHARRGQALPVAVVGVVDHAHDLSPPRPEVRAIATETARAFVLVGWDRPIEVGTPAAGPVET